MRNSNTDPTPNPSPTREGRAAAVIRAQGPREALPSLVGEGPGVGSVTQHI